MNITKPRLLGISGSLRRASFNTTVLTTLAERLAEQAVMTVHPLNDLPLYDQDLDTDTPPPAVTALRRAIAEADGVIIASPEYNYGISGVLKNALDWASRPYGKSALVAKPVLTLTSSPAFTGGARAQAQLNEVLTAVAALLVLRPQTVIPSVHEKIKDGRLVDEASLGFLDAGVSDLLGNIRSREAVVRQET